VRVYALHPVLGLPGILPPGLRWSYRN
jgi:hypothetical protein